jgi:hypothetical protein
VRHADGRAREVVARCLGESAQRVLGGDVDGAGCVAVVALNTVEIMR